MDAILSKVKNALGITSEAQDETLDVYIDGIKTFMKSAGVSDTVLNSDIASGAIVAGVIDTWNYGSGEVKLSPYTKERIIQLKFAKVPNENESNEESEG